MSPAIRARQLVVAGDLVAASDLVAGMITSITDRAVLRVDIGNDEYSLNSVNGRAYFADGGAVFFKFHVEEGEEGRVGEYYRATVLSDAGLPVDVPLAISTDPGQQIVLYEIRDVPRMSDICLDIERQSGSQATLPDRVSAARQRLDTAIGEVLARTVQVSADPQPHPAALHQLFTNRMTNSFGGYPGGRLLDWYLENDQWATLASANWTLNGVTYRHNLQELIEEARTLLDPSRFVSTPLVVAHGDDHHGNVWVIETAASTELRLFDPAFAGDDIPALLALVKSTFHNVFAHPFWLYHPQLVVDDDVYVKQVGDQLVVRDGFIGLSPLRQCVLDSIVERSWIPLLQELRNQDLLDPQWRSVVRAGLFLCPLLVMNLLGESRSPALRHVGLARAVMMGSEPAEGHDAVSEMLDKMQAAVDGA
jgi:hypothetical protein